MANRSFVIFGAGRVGRNISAYLAHLGHEARLVTREQAERERRECERLIARSDVVAAAVPDGRLSAWAEQWRGPIAGKTAIHFSGAISVSGLLSYHPLYSFPTSLLAPEVMSAIAIARQEGAPPFAEIAPGAPNPEFTVADADRAYYHALAVLSGNFAAFLWNETAKSFARRLDIEPAAVLASYLSGVVDRFAESPFDSLTGPVARRDRASVEANLAALEGEPKLAALYRAFLQAAWPAFDFEEAGRGSKLRAPSTAAASSANSK